MNNLELFEQELNLFNQSIEDSLQPQFEQLDYYDNPNEYTKGSRLQNKRNKDKKQRRDKYDW